MDYGPKNIILDKNTLFIDERSKKPKWNPRIETYNIM